VIAVVALCFLGGPRAKQDAAVDYDPGFAAAPLPKKPAAKKKSVAKPLITLTPENEQRVQLATQRGVDYLKKRQLTQGPHAGSWPGEFPIGYAALGGLSLLECKVPPGDTSVQRAAEYIRANAGGRYNHHETYQVALALLFLARLDDDNDVELIR